MNKTSTKSGTSITYDDDTFKSGDSGTVTCTVEVTFSSGTYTATHNFSIESPSMTGSGTIVASVADDAELSCEIAAKNSSTEIEWTHSNGSEATSGVTSTFGSNKVTSKLR